jgi:hypothetical protein
VGVEKLRNVHVRETHLKMRARFLGGSNVKTDVEGMGYEDAART